MVSESTVRRDLDQLEEQGSAKRIHGGVLYTGTSPKLPHFDARQPAQWDQKTGDCPVRGGPGAATAIRYFWMAAARPTRWHGCWSAGRCTS